MVDISTYQIQVNRSDSAFITAYIQPIGLYLRGVIMRSKEELMKIPVGVSVMYKGKKGGVVHHRIIECISRTGYATKDEVFTASQVPTWVCRKAIRAMIASALILPKDEGYILYPNPKINK
jgi:hypothetical protein